MKNVFLLVIISFYVSLSSSTIAKSPRVIIYSDTIANIAEKVSKSVVNISTINSQNLSNTKQAESGTGSGVVIRSNGYILTNYHVVKNSNKIIVTLNNEKKFLAELFAKDTYSDLAIVKINATNLPVANFANTENLRVGDWVIAIGSPLGLEHTVTHGIISALSRHVGVSFGAAQGAFKYIQTDAAINPGNSGGPLLNLLGEVIGINTFIIGRNAQNLNFAIPSDYAKDISDKLISKGSIDHPYLGVKASFLDPELKNIFGIFVVEVIDSSPAQKASIQAGDIIQFINNIKIVDPTQIADILKDKKVGDKLTIKLLRKNQPLILSVNVGVLPESP